MAEKLISNSMVLDIHRENPDGSFCLAWTSPRVAYSILGSSNSHHSPKKSFSQVHLLCKALAAHLDRQWIEFSSLRESNTWAYIEIGSVAFCSKKGGYSRGNIDLGKGGGILRERVYFENVEYICLKNRGIRA